MLHGLLVCLVDKAEYPFIILRQTKSDDIMFCLEDEIVEGGGYRGSPKGFYYVIEEGEKNSIRGKIVSKRCYFSDRAGEAFENEYGLKLGVRDNDYSLIKPYLRYKEVEITYKF